MAFTTLSLLDCYAPTTKREVCLCPSVHPSNLEWRRGHFVKINTKESFVSFRVAPCFIDNKRPFPLFHCSRTMEMAPCSLKIAGTSVRTPRKVCVVHYSKTIGTTDLKLIGCIIQGVNLCTCVFSPSWNLYLQSYGPSWFCKKMHFW